jgi:hypothetical protein
MTSPGWQVVPAAAAANTIFRRESNHMKRTYIAPEEHAYPPHGQTRNTTRPTARAPLTPAGADELRALMERLGKARRRREFKTVPMILTRPEEWDHEALSEVLAYKAGPRQVWDNTEIGGPG